MGIKAEIKDKKERRPAYPRLVEHKCGSIALLTCASTGYVIFAKEPHYYGDMRTTSEWSDFDGEITLKNA